MTRKLSEAVREPLGGAAEPWVIDGIEGLENRLETVRQERDALAAHVEDWRIGIALAKAWHWERDERGYAGSKKEADAFLDWLADRDQNDAPATSLARLKAEWQAERDALTEYVKNVRPYLIRWLHYMEEVYEATDDSAVFWDLEEARKIIEAPQG